MLFPIRDLIAPSRFDVGVQNGDSLRVIDELPPIRQQRLKLVYRKIRIFLMDDHQQVIRGFCGSGYDLIAAFALPVTYAVMNVPPIPACPVSLRHRVALPVVLRSQTRKLPAVPNLPCRDL